jgi:hypothetical protein
MSPGPGLTVAAAYRCSVVPVGALDKPTRKAMAALYLQTYAGSSAARFARDLQAKDEVLLMHTAAGELAGFTTLRIFDDRWQAQPLRVVYSGDTVVRREHWGQQALSFAWVRRMGQIKRASPGVRLVWLLLVKGHRTYRFLPVFALQYHPDPRQPQPALARLAEHLAGRLFPRDYNPSTGCVEFRPSRGHLRPAFAEPRPDEHGRRGVEAFLALNPGYREGHELVCLCDLEEPNMKPLTRRLFRQGLDDRH